jgi:hypothetical protein
MSAKLVPTFADRGCHVVIVTDPYGRNLGFLDRIIIIIKTKLNSIVWVRERTIQTERLSHVGEGNANFCD